MRVSHYMLEQGVNQLIDKRLKPVYASLVETLEKVDIIMIGPFEIMKERLERLEMSVFGQNSGSNKLDILTA